MSPNINWIHFSNDMNSFKCIVTTTTIKTFFWKNPSNLQQWILIIYMSHSNKSLNTELFNNSQHLFSVCNNLHKFYRFRYETAYGVSTFYMQMKFMIYFSGTKTLRLDLRIHKVIKFIIFLLPSTNDFVSRNRSIWNHT